MDRSDRRRINPPSGGTAPPVFAAAIGKADSVQRQRPTRTRKSDELRKTFLQTNIVPSASGSSYLELQPSSTTPPPNSLVPSASSLKLTCTVHGPKPLPRSAPFSPHLVLTTHVKFAPFATRQRRGYIRDATERDLGVHLETALRGVIIGERWPKSGVDVVVTVLEGEEDRWWGDEVGGGSKALGGSGSGWGLMTVLAGCITAASAAIVDAGIDCVDLVSAGVAAIPPSLSPKASGVILDPCPSEHQQLGAACVVAYLQTRDEITELWLKGSVDPSMTEILVDHAVKAAVASRAVLAAVVKESTEQRLGLNNVAEQDVDMSG